MRRVVLIAAVALAAPAVAQGPGQLLSAEPVVDTPAGMQAWRVRYLTRDDHGAPRQVTGLVVAPREALPARPPSSDRMDAWYFRHREPMCSIAVARLLDPHPSTRSRSARLRSRSTGLSWARKSGSSPIFGWNGNGSIGAGCCQVSSGNSGCSGRAALRGLG